MTTFAEHLVKKQYSAIDAAAISMACATFVAGYLLGAFLVMLLGVILSSTIEAYVKSKNKELVVSDEKIVKKSSVEHTIDIS